MRSFTRLFALLLVLIAPAALAQEGLTRLLHYPDIHGDTIAFVYAGDIWTVPASGGTATRLTSDPGLELFPKFSPDGRWIAFSAQYDGTRQVWVIPTEGGTPRQLTFHNDVGDLPPRGGYDNQVLDWSPDGKYVLFLAHRLPWGERMSRHYIVPFEGGMEQPLAIPQGSAGMFSPDGTRVVYTPISREYRTWKRYRGGRAQEVWIYNLKDNSAEQITHFEGTDNQPTWVGDTIYFTSDRDYTLNLFAYDTKTKQITRVTDQDTWDVLWPSAGPKQIVYQAGGFIWRFDPATRQSTRVPIRVVGDFRARLPHYENVKSNIDTASISPTGVRAVFGARGDVFTVPAKEGETQDLTRSSGVREIDPTWSPDGRLIAYLSDRSGEYEIYVRNADGSGEERQLTTNGHTWRFQPTWSPDGKWIVFGDKDATLRLLDVSSGKIRDLDRGTYNDITWYRWSPDSRWITYTKVGDSRMSNIFVYSLDQSRSLQLTSGMTDEQEPTFSPDGNYLYFLSNRDFNLTFSAFEFAYVYTHPTRVYVGVLAKDGPALFLPENPEEKVAAPPTTPKPAEKEAEKETTPTPPTVTIDPEGFEQRVRAIPGDPDDYHDLAAVDAGVLYISGQGRETKLQLYDIKDKKEDTVLSGVQGYELSANGKKILYRAAGAYGIVDAAAGQKTEGAALDLGHMEMTIDPSAEWHEEFVDAWRTLRDWFYDPNMHGVDWKAMRAKYEPLVAHIAHRTDLDFILGEMGGELNVGHMYVQSSNDWQIKRNDSALLGAEVAADPSGYFRITDIFPGENWHQDFRSPLTEPGVNVKEGDYILAVDGVSTKGVDNFYRLLQNKADRLITLRVSAGPTATGAHDEIIRPITQETNLRYLEWVESRRAWVEKASNGQIGYIHLPNTAQEGNRELFKNFYPQANKAALLIDVRYNGGGFIPDQMISLLDRPVLSYWEVRNLEPFVTPGFAHKGPKAVLINGYSSSGGDAFPFYFRERGLGPLIGTRTWGGLAGLSGNPDLMDGGTVLVPSFRIFDDQGIWQVENIGVAPDIEVVDRPDAEARGTDPSLEKGVQVLMEELKKNPPQKVVPPKPPIETVAPGQERPRHQ